MGYKNHKQTSNSTKEKASRKQGQKEKRVNISKTGKKEKVEKKSG